MEALGPLLRASKKGTDVHRILIPALLALMLLPQTSTAQEAPSPAGSSVGDLLVAPTRILFDGNDRSSEVTLVNTGDGEATYRISLMHLEMTPLGELKEVTEGEFLAEPLIRFSPRQVTLEPNVAQTVRLQIRKPAELPAGEYRSHMLFRAIPKPAGADTLDEEPAQGLVIRLTPVYGVSIPIIVRHEVTGATAGLEGLALEPGDETTPPGLRVTILRDGDRSVYGKLIVRLVREGMPPTIIGVMNGVAVYTPLPARAVRIPLQLDETTTPLDRGKLEVEYRDLEERDEALLATAVLPLV